MGNKGIKSVQLSHELKERVVGIFKKIDIDGSNTIDKEETLKFWQSNFAKLNTQELFKAVDMDHNGSIELDEWILFWEHCKAKGVSEDEIFEELENLEQGQSWVSFDTKK